jgi:hypothetical protein
MTRQSMLVPLLLAALSTACGSKPDGAATEEQGSVQMELTTTVGSTTYRLSSAFFDVVGPENVVLDGSSVDVLTHSLPAGNYGITLEPGFVMEQTVSGMTEAVDAELLSPNPQMFTIAEFAVTPVLFRFKVGDAVVNLGRGDLEVSIGVTTTFFGPRTNFSPSELSGWTQCYSDTFDNFATSLGAIQMACPGNELMLACRPVGSSTLTLAAHGPRAAVLRDTGVNSTTVSRANGSDWYFNDSWSWGFAPAGANVDKNSCDIGDAFSPMPDDTRLCFHTGSGTINAGYRCGSNQGLFANDWERVIYSADL